jgi:hypothetical protein
MRTLEIEKIMKLLLVVLELALPVLQYQQKMHPLDPLSSSYIQVDPPLGEEFS